MLLQTDSFWQVGTIVPLATIVLVSLFSLLYFFKWKKFIAIKKNHAKSLYFFELCRDYININSAYKKIEKSFFWNWFWVNRYLDLVTQAKERAKYELDKIDQFQEDVEENLIYNRTSFHYQWEYMKNFLYVGMDGYGRYVLSKNLDRKPFYELESIVENKLYVLYKKQAQFLLRSKGYYVFSEFLLKHRDESCIEQGCSPFYTIHAKFNDKIILNYANEIAERIKHELGPIMERKNSGETNARDDLKALSDTYVLNSYSLLNPQNELFDIKVLIALNLKSLD